MHVEYEVWDALRSRFVFAEIVLAGESTWQRKVGQPKNPFLATFTEVQTSRLKLRITDHRNPPLKIRSINFGAPARQIVFAQPSQDAGEVRLYFGNPLGEPPNYDFARNLPAKIEPSPSRVTLGDVVPNPEFIPPPKALTERYPWLIYAVLAAVSVILAVVIISLSRVAIAFHDMLVTDQL